MRKTRIPNIIALMLLVTGLAAGVFLVQERQNLRLSASPTVAPKDLRVTNVTDKSFTVSWYTDENSSSFLNYGDNPRLGRVIYGQDRNERRLHYMIVEDLSPSTKYYFEINSNGDKFDNSGIPWTVTTGPTLSNAKTSGIISGKVITRLETPAVGAVVYLQLGGGQLISVQTSSEGNFILPLSKIREQSLENYLQIDPTNTLVDMFIQSGPLGVASAQFMAANANPLPTIQLGENYDLRNNNFEETNVLPEAKIQLPDEPTDSILSID